MSDVFESLIFFRKLHVTIMSSPGVVLLFPMGLKSSAKRVLTLFENHRLLCFLFHTMKKVIFEKIKRTRDGKSWQKHLLRDFTLQFSFESPWELLSDIFDSVFFLTIFIDQDSLQDDSWGAKSCAPFILATSKILKLGAEAVSCSWMDCVYHCRSCNSSSQHQLWTNDWRLCQVWHGVQLPSWQSNDRKWNEQNPSERHNTRMWRRLWGPSKL